MRIQQHYMRRVGCEIRSHWFLPEICQSQEASQFNQFETDLNRGQYITHPNTALSTGNPSNILYIGIVWSPEMGNSLMPVRSAILRSCLFNKKHTYTKQTEPGFISKKIEWSVKASYLDFIAPTRYKPTGFRGDWLFAFTKKLSHSLGTF